MEGGVEARESDSEEKEAGGGVDGAGVGMEFKGDCKAGGVDAAVSVAFTGDDSIEGAEDEGEGTITGAGGGNALGGGGIADRAGTLRVSCLRFRSASSLAFRCASDAAACSSPSSCALIPALLFSFRVASFASAGISLLAVSAATSSWLAGDIRDGSRGGSGAARGVRGVEGGN